MLTNKNIVTIYFSEEEARAVVGEIEKIVPTKELIQKFMNLFELKRKLCDCLKEDND
jgi:hypothetical protein